MIITTPTNLKILINKDKKDIEYYLFDVTHNQFKKDVLELIKRTKNNKEFVNEFIKF